MTKVFCMYIQYHPDCPHARYYKKYEYRPICNHTDKLMSKNDGTLVTENCGIE